MYKINKTYWDCVVHTVEQTGSFSIHSLSLTNVRRSTSETVPATLANYQEKSHFLTSSFCLEQRGHISACTRRIVPTHLSLSWCHQHIWLGVQHGWHDPASLVPTCCLSWSLSRVSSSICCSWSVIVIWCTDCCKKHPNMAVLHVTLRQREYQRFINWERMSNI